MVRAQPCLIATGDSTASKYEVEYHQSSCNDETRRPSAERGRNQKLKFKQITLSWPTTLSISTTLN